MRTYQHPTENREFYSPDREPYANLSFQIEHISGMDNYSKPHPLMVKRSDYAAAHGISEEAVVSHATTGSGPSASFLGSDMRAAYASGTTLTGAGQTVGLLEYYGTDLADLTTYYKNIGQTEPFTPKLVSVDGTSTSCLYASGCDDGEQNLDMTQAMGMAPGLAGLTMYIGSTDTAIISAMTTTADGPLPGTIGCSWGWTPADPSTLDGYFETMAAQGQNFFAASGDSSTWSSSNEAWPADDALCRFGRRHGPGHLQRGRPLVLGDRLGRLGRRHLAGFDRHPLVAGGLGRDQLQQQRLDDPAQRPGCLGQRQLHLLHLRRSDDLPGQRVRWHQLCRAHVGRLHRSGQPATGGQRQIEAIGFLNPIIYPIGTSSSYGTNFHDITSGTSPAAIRRSPASIWSPAGAAPRRA